MTLRLCDYKIVNTWHGSTRKKKNKNRNEKKSRINCSFILDIQPNCFRNTNNELKSAFQR